MPRRTAEEIRAATRAELPALRAIAKRLRALGREVTQTPEYRRWDELFDTDGEDSDEFHELSVYVSMHGTLVDDLREDLAPLIRQLAAETDPRAWAIAKERAPQLRAKAAAYQAKLAKPLPPSPRVLVDRAVVAELAEGIAALAKLLDGTSPPEALLKAQPAVQEVAELLREWAGAGLKRPERAIA